MDTVLIENNIVVQVWRNKVAEDLNLPDAQLVEFESGTAIAGMVFDGETVSIPPKPITSDDVNTERERRVNLVVPIYLSTGKVFAVDMAGGGRANIGDLALMAVIKNGAGITTDFTFRDANDTDQTLTNDEVIEMGMQAAASFDYYYKKSWALKELSPIPQDYTDDSYWL